MKTVLIGYLTACVGATLGFLFGAMIRVGKESEKHVQAELQRKKNDL